MGYLKRFTGNIGRVVSTLGAALLAVALLGLAAELARRSALESGPASPTTLGETLGMGLAVGLVTLPVAAAMVAIPIVVIRLFRLLHACSTPEEAHDALNRLVFGQLGRRPYILVREGAIASGENSFAGRAGGPATAIVYSDTAVVTEQYGGLHRVLGPGIHDLERFEKIWEAVDLRPQQWVYEVFALTKDGIPISCEADITFQINDEPQRDGVQVHDEGPYPFAEDAVFLAATNTWIREAEREDHIMTWAGRVVIGHTEGLLRNILAEYRLDWLIAPTQPDNGHPREEIRQRLYHGLKDGVQGVGAKLKDVQIGAIEVKARDELTSRRIADIVTQQWVDTWYADWENRALESRVEGEAELLQMDTARIHAQAEMVVTLTEALQSTMVRQGSVEPYLLALRFVEALRWMSYNTINREFMPPEATRTLKRMEEMVESESSLLDELRRRMAMED